MGVSDHNFPHDKVYTTSRKEKQGVVSKATEEREVAETQGCTNTIEDKPKIKGEREWPKLKKNGANAFSSNFPFYTQKQTKTTLNSAPKPCDASHEFFVPSQSNPTLQSVGLLCKSHSDS